MESLAQLEALCDKLYNSQDSEERAHAESSLKCFSVNADYISQCQYILDNAVNPYALMLASSSLSKQLTENSFPLQLRLDIRNYVISYLATRGPNLESFVCGSLIQLFCQVTKFGWLDDDRFREAVKEAMDFLTQETSLYAIGLKILNQLVTEVNQHNRGNPSTHRKIACSFRDLSLLHIFRISLTCLYQLKDDKDDDKSKLQELAVSLSLACLSFDFMGTSSDETSDEFGTVQVSSSWKSVIEDPSSLQIFFDYYAFNKSHISKEALGCLVRLASIRRSLFTDDAARLKFLSHLMTGTKIILQTGIGLSDHDNYHEFCRLVGRFKVNFQLSELVNMDGYCDWIHLISEFTLKSLRSWQWASSGVYYLMGLWSRLVTSVPYVKSTTPNLLDKFVLNIVQGFIESRLNSFQDGSSVDPSNYQFDNVELIQDHLDCIPYLCRFQYEICSTYILKIMDHNLQIYMEGVNILVGASNDELSVMESKLAWMVHIIAAILKTKQVSGFSSESQELLDAELSARVLQLISVTDSGLHSQRYSKLSKQRLDRAIVIFFQHFRKSYVGDQAMHSSKLYNRLSELLGLHDHLLILNVIVRKIVTNLKCYTESVDVIDDTLNFFGDLASGFMTGRLLLKLDATNFLISHHSREQFPFLGNYRCSRSRTTFFHTIGCLIFMEDSIFKFKTSMDPLLQVFVSLESTPDALFRTDSVKYALIGLTRDLRGITMATDSRRTYGFLFDWLYPARLPLFLKCIAHWADSPEVTTPLLKFVAELVFNKSQRLTFDSSSPNSILLFREVSKLLVAYGTRILSLPNCSDMYAAKYKGIWISLLILARAIFGNYVNFGVFELYGDRALADALDIALKMALSIPLVDILAYKKLTGSYFTFLDALFTSHINFVLNLDTATFIYIVGSLGSGLKGLDSNILSQCASAVDKMATFYFDHIILGESSSSPAALKFAQHFSECPAVFADILQRLFEIILYEDCGTVWSLSRAMMSLTLMSSEMFTTLKAQIVCSQPVDQQQRISICFDNLMEGVTPSLDPKNRDRFTQNVARLRNDFRSK